MMVDALWLDSSVIRQLNVSKMRALADLAREKGIRVVVHAHIHLEMCRRLREQTRKRRREFSPSYIQTSLEQLGFDIADAVLDRTAAEDWARLLDERYTTEEAWQKAKLDAVGARLPAGTHLPADRVPMTTDWLVALEVERQGACVAVADKGIEWTALREMSPCRALSYEDAIRWLNSRARATTDAPKNTPTDPTGGASL